MRQAEGDSGQAPRVADVPEGVASPTDTAPAADAEGRAPADGGTATGPDAAMAAPSPECARAGRDLDQTGDETEAVASEGEPADASQHEPHALVQDFLTSPARWSLWPAVALLRWMMADTGSIERLVYRSRPSLGFSGSEICDVGIGDDRIDLVLSAPGLAAPGSALPLPDIARIVADTHRPDGGALAYWLDGLVDRLMQAVEESERRTSSAFALATGAELHDVDSALKIAGSSAPLRAQPGGMLTASDADGESTPVPGLARLFVGHATAVGLESLVGGFTELPVEVEEFVPISLPVVAPVRMGGTLGGRAIGTEGSMSGGAVQLVLDGTSTPASVHWAQDPVRSRSLAALCEAYVGGPVPEVRLFVDVAGETTAGASLDATPPSAVRRCSDDGRGGYACRSTRAMSSPRTGRPMMRVETRRPTLDRRRSHPVVTRLGDVLAGGEPGTPAAPCGAWAWPVGLTCRTVTSARRVRYV